MLLQLDQLNFAILAARAPLAQIEWNGECRRRHWRHGPEHVEVGLNKWKCAALAGLCGIKSPFSILQVVLWITWSYMTSDTNLCASGG